MWRAGGAGEGRDGAIEGREANGGDGDGGSGGGGGLSWSYKGICQESGTVGVVGMV